MARMSITLICDLLLCWRKQGQRQNVIIFINHHRNQGVSFLQPLHCCCLRNLKFGCWFSQLAFVSSKLGLFGITTNSLQRQGKEHRIISSHKPYFPGLIWGGGALIWAVKNSWNTDTQNCLLSLNTRLTNLRATLTRLTQALNMRTILEA